MCIVKVRKGNVCMRERLLVATAGVGSRHHAKTLDQTPCHVIDFNGPAIITI